MSAREREKEKKLPRSVSIQKKGTGFDIVEEKFPPSPVGSNLFYKYKDTQPFPCPALLLQRRVFPRGTEGESRANRECDGMKRGVQGKDVKGYMGRIGAGKGEMG